MEQLTQSFFFFLALILPVCDVTKARKEEEIEEWPALIETQARSCSPPPPFIFRVLCSLLPLLSARGESREGLVVPGARGGGEQSRGCGDQVIKGYPSASVLEDE